MSLEGLDEGQYAAASHNDGRHGLASAGPGSGKTKTVIAHVGELLRRGGNPKAIQVLAFSADAVEEFSKRLAASGAPGANQVSVRTLHSLGLRICGLMQRNGIVPEAGLLTDKDASKIQMFMREALAEEDQSVWDVDDLQLDVMGQALTMAKSTLVRLDQEPPIEVLLRLAEGDEQVARALVRFEAIRAEQGFRTFDDLIYDVARALQDDPRAWRLVTNRFDNVIVDEYQDIDDAQQLLIKALIGTRGRGLVVGDEDQCIFDWRGANLHYMLSGFEETYADVGVTRYFLSRTYRYGHELAIGANSLIRHNTERPDKTCISAPSTPATRVEMVMPAMASQDDQWPDLVLQALDRWEVQGRKLGEAVVLVRAFSIAAPLELALLKQKRPYHLEGKGVLEMPEVKALMAYTALQSEPYWQNLSAAQRQTQWQLILGYPGAFLPRALINNVTEAMAVAAIPAEALEILRQAAWADGVSGQHARALSMRADVIDRVLRAPAEPASIAEEVWSRLNWAQDIRRRVNDPIKQQERIDTLALVRDQISGFQTLEDLLETYSQGAVKGGGKKDSGRLKIMSMHASKGLEYPLVIVPGLADGQMPFIHPERPTNMEAERRLLMVAMTRAQEQLLLVAPNDADLAKRWEIEVNQQFSRRGDDAKAVTSRFLPEIDVESIRAARTHFYKVGAHPMTEGLSKYLEAMGPATAAEELDAPAVETKRVSTAVLDLDELFGGPSF
ncbi:ATP-dependent helicase [Pseudomonas aeruginosa]|nr:ATP-dependent helicase [Pseudomonas aeruginosa]